MGILKEINSLVRTRQWYKNLLIFLPIIFAKEILNFNAITKTILAFFVLCFVSSTNYIINDLKDIKKDRNHPEKKYRPLASGKISKASAYILIFGLIVCSGILLTQLSVIFSFVALGFFILSQAYTFFLKKEAFADILTIATNFVIRAFSGTIAITHNNQAYLRISPWLILCPFFLALFLAVSKREGDLIILGENAKKHKEVFNIYNKQITHTIMIISTTLLVISYSLYTFLSVSPKLIVTIPFAMYCIFRYLYLVESGSEIARHPEKVYKDKRLVIAAALCGLLMMVGVYL